MLLHISSKPIANGLLLLLLCRLTAGHTETQVVAAERRFVVVAVRRPAVVRVAPPAAAAMHAGRARAGANWIGAARRISTLSDLSETEDPAAA